MGAWLLGTLLLGGAVWAEEPAGHPVVDVLDRTVLEPLETSGYGLHALLGGLLGGPVEAPPPGRVSNAWMSEHSGAYAPLAGAWSEHIQAVIDSVERPLVVEHEHAKAFPAGNVGRAFDVRWFSSEKAFFQLVGVVNRVDRRDFGPGSCGEVRFIYRLAYAMEHDGGVFGSRLPMTVNVVLEADGSDCKQSAQRWIAPKDEMTAPDTLAWLRAGPLQQLALKQIEVNAQVVRFPSGLETEFAGQAIYLLRIYGLERQGRTVEVSYRPLENTPDVQRIRQDEALMAELVVYIGGHLTEIDTGLAILPEHLLAEQALSYSTLGVNRLANKPFDVLFEGEAGRALLPEIESGSFASMSSRAGLVERLNNRTCMGCHQVQSTAGFHFLGREDESLSGITNRLQLPISIHYSNEQAYRRDYLATVAAGGSPNTARPHSLAPASGSPAAYPKAGVNMSCVPPAHASDFPAAARWDCKEGLECRVVAADSRVAINFGQCIVPPERPEDLFSGMTCREGKVASGDSGPQGVFNQHAYKDTFTHTQLYGLAEDKSFSEDAFNCRPTRIGVPLGRTFRRCTAEERTLSDVVGESVADDICAVVGGARFDRCVEGNFHACLEGIIGRGMVDSCHPGRACREDYICQALPYQHPSVPTEAGEALHKAGVGFCTPTYFVFQLRLDGHPVP
jgi:hypothetical protein